MLSTESSAKSVVVRSQATGRTAPKPLVVDEYNYSMNGVDRADQYTVYYAFVRKSRKWWRKLFFWLFEVTLVNSYILYRISVPSPKSHFHFRRSIVDALAIRHLTTAPPHSDPGWPSRRQSSDPQRYNHQQQHYLAMRQQRECVLQQHTARKEKTHSILLCSMP